MSVSNCFAFGVSRSSNLALRLQILPRFLSRRVEPQRLVCIRSRLHQEWHRHDFRDDVRPLHAVSLYERLGERSHQSSLFVQQQCGRGSQLLQALDRLGAALAARAMPVVLSTAEGLSHDRHSVWRLWGEAQATDMTTNKSLSSSGCRAAPQESQIETGGSRTLSTAESLRSSKLLPLGHQ